MTDQILESQLARLTSGRRWPQTAPVDRRRMLVSSRYPEFALRGASRALWRLEHQVTVRIAGARLGGSASLQPLEVAGAFSGLFGAPLHMGRLVLLGDESELRPLLLEAVHIGVSLAARRGWDIPRPGFLRDLMALGVLEVVDCRALQSDRWRAEQMRLPASTWRRTWSPRYEQHVFPTVAGWPVVALDHVARRLGIRLEA